MTETFIISLLAILIVSALFLGIVYLLKKYSKNPDRPRLSVERSKKNPLLHPDAHPWKSLCVFNPTATIDENGEIHMLYRAIGDDGVSRLGYATSQNGTDFEDETVYPIFSVEGLKNKSQQNQSFNTALNPSGGSWFGVEDPRMVVIDNRAYVTFTVFGGWDFIRVGLTSIDLKDLTNKHFNWDKVKIISPVGEIHKNWILFPEKINGKFALLHSINPEVQIEYLDNFDALDQGKEKINSRFGQKQPREAWDTFVRSAGPPPVKTDKGWLVLYHAVNKDFPQQYRLGALLLDKDDPTKIIARAPEPLMIPDKWYENDWKPGIIYACGAVIKDKDLYIYYGGGDKYVCTARTPLEPLLDWLIASPLKN